MIRFEMGSAPCRASVSVVAKSLMDSPSLTSSNLRLLRFRTGAEKQRRSNSRPLNVADPQAILIVYLFFNLPSWGFHPRGSLIAPHVHFSRGTKL
jgi:hypothetical protein